MKLEELAGRIGTGIVVRYFASQQIPAGGRWSVATSPHYYTSDTNRLSLGDRDELVGWGDTLNDAVRAFVAHMSERARMRVQAAREHLAAQTQAAETLISALNEAKT